ncbi:MAG: IclR family transcriptional regulator [Anaerolineae bacterium]|jgi:DNA-binding IclR family transcriptional regulator
MSEQRDAGSVTRSVARAMELLQAFDETRPELGVTELGRLTGIDKSTVYRLLGSLQRGGLIEQNPETSKYYLGFGLVRLAGLALQHLDLPRMARPHLRRLAEASQETVNLSVMTSDGQIVNIEGVNSPRMVRNVGWIGREMPIHAVSAGKVMMAHLAEKQVDRILARELKAFTEHTVTDQGELQKELEQIRRQGYGIAEEELEMGLSAVAAPIWSHEGQVAASISISGPSFRLPRERLVELGIEVKRVADTISQKMDHISKLDSGEFGSIRAEDPELHGSRQI